MTAAIICPDEDAFARSKSAAAQFKRLHPCPTTGHARGACAGYVIDHITPLCAGGPDHPSNMQWQTTAESKVKDVEERKFCARERKDQAPSRRLT